MALSSHASGFLLPLRVKFAKGACNLEAKVEICAWFPSCLPQTPRELKGASVIPGNWLISQSHNFMAKPLVENKTRR